MTFSKASRLPVLAAALCLLLMGFAGASYGAVRFDAVPSPTEVINTGLSEVTGGINLIVRGTGNVTGTSTGGFAQIGIIYNSNGTYTPIDNTTATGIRIFFTAGFNTANPTILSVVNQSIAGKCSGFITINLVNGATPVEGDFIRIEGVRGRIAISSGQFQGTDIYASLQSINDPSANQFTPDAVRVAKSLPGMSIKVTSANVLLCFPTTGVPPSGTANPTYGIKITEGFARAFVDLAAGVAGGTVAGATSADRVDSGGQTAPQVYVPGAPPTAATVAALGAPTNSTRFTILVDSIPASVSGIIWPASSTTDANSGAALAFVTSATDGAGNATGVYSYEAVNQTNQSDIYVETFTVQPVLKMLSGATATGTVNVAVTLSPNGGTADCSAPGNSANDVRPRFLLVPQSNADPSQENPTPGDPSVPYALIIRCNCFMLFTYVTSAAGFNTGIAVANTSQDSQVFGTGVTPQQVGKITFYFYSATGAYRGYFVTGDVPFGQSFVGLLSSMLGTTNMADTTFSGYVIAKAEFQYCHAISYISDNAFAATAQGYAALIIPDPAIKGAGKRYAADAGDLTNVPAGEGLNN